MAKTPRISVPLTDDDLKEIQDKARARASNCRRHGISQSNLNKDRYENLDAIHADGMKAEKALAKWSGLPWNDRLFSRAEYENADLRDHDVGHLEVRSTQWDTGRLLVHHKDADDAPFILAIIKADRVEFVGWMKGSDAKQDKFWASWMRPPCFAVPQSDLIPLDRLPLSASQ